VTETSGTSVKTYSYDPNGNVLTTVEEVMGIEIAREDMTYDELNRMHTHTGPGGTETSTYRGAEWHRASANGKQFLYDGDNVLADIAGGATSAFYVTPFLDQNLSMTTGGSTDYYSQDGLGSVRTLTDSTGTVKNTYDYLPFGGAYQPGTSVTVEQRYTYTGREKNPESALMYYRYRQYDPRVGRFGGRDPIGRTAVALYSYASNAPTSLVDPFGLFTWTWDSKGCKLTMNFVIEIDSWVENTPGFWTVARKATATANLKAYIEQVWNDRSKKAAIFPKNKEYGLLFKACCPCYAGGVEPTLNITVTPAGWEDLEVDLYETGQQATTKPGIGWGYYSWETVAPNNSPGTIGHEFGHAIGLEHPGHGLPGIDPNTIEEYDWVGEDENGNQVNGPTDLMGSGFGLQVGAWDMQPFYWQKWADEMNDRYPYCDYFCSE
ncbi:MAG: RHS repeat-associated core domain-containing protein, partial [Planctomycetota bacterium]|jgi:RHS repeat-associated protein